MKMIASSYYYLGGSSATVVGLERNPCTDKYDTCVWFIEGAERIKLTISEWNDFYTQRDAYNQFLKGQSNVLPIFNSTRLNSYGVESTRTIVFQSSNWQIVRFNKFNIINLFLLYPAIQVYVNKLEAKKRFRADMEFKSITESITIELFPSTSLSTSERSVLVSKIHERIINFQHMSGRVVQEILSINERELTECAIQLLRSFWSEM